MLKRQLLVKSSILVLLVFSSQISFAQEADENIRNAKRKVENALNSGDCDKAQKYYNTLKIIADRSYSDLELRIAECYKNTPGQTPTSAKLSLSNYSLKFSLKGGEKKLIVTASEDWHIEMQPDSWVTVATAKAKNTITVSVNESTDTKKRTFFFIVVCGNIKKRVDIIQEISKIGDDAKIFICYSGYKIAHLDDSGKHGFAIKYDKFSKFPSGPTITELKLMNSNRYKLGLIGEYWSSTYAGGGNGFFNLSRYYTFNYDTGETNERRDGKSQYKRLSIIRF